MGFGYEPGSSAQKENNQATVLAPLRPADQGLQAAGRRQSSGASVTWRERLAIPQVREGRMRGSPRLFLEMGSSGGSDLRAGISAGVPPKLLQT